MKNYKYYFLVVLFIFGILIGQIINTFAKTSVDYYEEVIPIRNDIGNIIGEEVVITIPKGFNREIIKINSSVFDGFYHYSSDDEEFIVKITIANESKYDYQYINNSLVINPKSPFNSENYINNVMNNNIIISDSFYRSYNQALRKIVPEGSELSDEVIDFYLKKSGYSGIEELNKYYDNYYGRWYAFYLILEGDVSNYKETNSVLVEDAYRYFYSDMLSYSCLGKKFGVLKYNHQCENIYSIFSKRSKTTMSDMKIYLNNNDYFDKYLVSVNFQFELFRLLT